MDPDIYRKHVDCATCPRETEVPATLEETGKRWLCANPNTVALGTKDEEELSMFFAGMLLTIHRDEKNLRLRRANITQTPKGDMVFPEIAMRDQGMLWVCPLCADLLRRNPDRVSGAINTKRWMHLKLQSELIGMDPERINEVLPKENLTNRS